MREKNTNHLLGDCHFVLLAQAQNSPVACYYWKEKRQNINLNISSMMHILDQWYDI
jgi:hypothetical protein